MRRSSCVLLLFACFAFSLSSQYVRAGRQAANHRPDAERININTATPIELQRLPGIGPAIAARIVEHRRKHGSFKRAQEIIIVRGMSARHYRKISHLIYI